MAEAAQDAASGGAEAPPKAKPSVAMLLALLNTVAVLAALGTFVYTRILYKRPAITESSERAKIEAEKANKAATGPFVSALIPFDPITVNIKTVTSEAEAGVPAQGKLHYVTVTFSVEIRDERKKAAVEEIKPALVDKVMNLIGRKAFGELTTVQGRYILRTQMIDLSNELLQKALKDKDTVVTNVFFTQFLVQ